MTVAEVARRLDLNSCLQNRSWVSREELSISHPREPTCLQDIFPTCARSGEGLHEGLDWLANNIQKRQQIDLRRTDKEMAKLEV